MALSGQGQGSGIQLERENGHVFTLRDGRAPQIDVHWEWEDALEAVGTN
jgi:hypothetical protein